MTAYVRARVASAAAALLTLATGPASAVVMAPVPFTAVYAFGDSLTDTGNVLGLTTALNAWIPQIPVVPQLFTQETGGYWNGRFSNGPVAVEVLAQRLGLPLSNFAYGGATSGQGPSFTSPLGSVSTGLQAQLANFTAGSAGQADPNGLYFLWIGGNDIRGGLDSLADPALTLPQKQAVLNTAVQGVALNLANSIGSLYGQGARNFLVPLLPDFGLTPEGAAAQALLDLAQVPFSLSSFSDVVNAALGNALSSANFPLPGATLTLFDPIPLQRAVAADPATYGIGSVLTPCFLGYVGEAGDVCEDGLSTTAMFWDKVHPSAITHQILGEAMAAAVPEPETMLLMAGGLVALLGLARRRQRAGA